MPSETDSYLDRVEVAGILKLETPLHIGCGETELSDRVRKRLREGDEPQMVEVALTIRDHSDRPCIPGSTLKGCLQDLCLQAQVKDRLFGYSRAEGDGSEKRWMGRLLIATATLRDQPDLANRPHPDANRGTFVDSRTKIDPGSGTADIGEGTGGQLFHIELVGPGATFDLRLTLIGPDEDDLTALGALLGHLKTGVLVGRGRKLGQGRICLTNGLTATHRSLSADGVWREYPVAMPEVVATARACRSETIELTCDGPYVTLDGSHEPAGEGEPQLVALIDKTGQPILNGSSVIGALRARCLWLARLSDATIADDPKRVLPWLEFPEVLSPVERLFGVAGWGSCVAIEKIEPIGHCEKIEITSVSIDRFTGGPREGPLYTTRAYLGAAFRISLMLRDRAGTETVDRDLFDALIADVRRNGIMLGHGAAKGFGWFRDAFQPVVEPTAQSILADLPAVPEPEWSKQDDRKLDHFERTSAKAPYSFVQLNKKIVMADEPPRHDRPAPDQFSGWIELAWIAETPLLLGVENDAGIVESFRLGEHGSYAIPGASLRGMIRAVFEIATFSKLGFINSDHRFALRNFEHARYKKLVMQPQGGVQAGWLRKEDETWLITPCEFRRIEHGEIAGLTAATLRWKQLDLDQKMTELSGKLEQRVVILPNDDFATLDLGRGAEPGARLVDGTLVVAGKFVGNKHYETVFF